MSIVIKSLEGESINRIYEAFSRAFEDYPFQWTEEMFVRMLQRRNFNPNLSFGAYQDNHLVSFILNGIGRFRMQATAYDIGTGTLASFRGQGLAGRVFEFAVQQLQTMNIHQYLLEVLCSNTPALSVYQKQGFEITRTFHCFLSKQKELPSVVIQEINPGIEVKEMPLALDETVWNTLCESYPSWQNHVISICNQPQRFRTLALVEQNKLLGLGVIEFQTGDIPLFAIHPDKRKQGLGTYLFQQLQKLNESGIVKMVNVDASNKAILNFIAKLGVAKNAEQFEMLKIL